MARTRDKVWDRRRLRRVLLLFFIALAVPSALLTWQAYSRLKWESFHQHQVLAEALRERIDRRLGELVAREEARSVADYGFLVVEGVPEANYLRRSPLSDFPVAGEVPGLLGYFQIDAQGRFTTPLLPEDPSQSPLAYGIDAAELAERKRLREQLLRILTGERMTANAGERLSARHDTRPTAVDRDVQARARNDVTDAFSRSPPNLADADTAGTRETNDAPDSHERRQAVARLSEELDTRAQAREQKMAQAAFVRLAGKQERPKPSGDSPAASSIGRVDELKLDQAFERHTADRQAAEGSLTAAPRPATPRKEREIQPTLFPDPYRATAVEREAATDPSPPPRVRFFESEIDPFAFGLLDRDHFVLYRKVWREGQRLIQGALLRRDTLLQQLVERPFDATTLSGMSRLAIAFDGDILSAVGADVAERYPPSTESLSGTLLYRSRMSAPLDQLELVFTVTSMPIGEGGRLVTWAALLMAFILSAGLYLMYRLGVRQIELHRQQRDFVSAVGHELKTPLTSIRMYSEMLREGWADEQRKRSYYEFIHDESERLSRLITNVLQLARMGRGELEVALRSVAVTQLLDLIRSKIVTQVERAGFALRLHCSTDAKALTLKIDEDALVQILINLVDNAIKFSTKAEEKIIDIGCSRLSDGQVQFSVRDYGPGIPKPHLKKIFLLFYRSEDELTRETVGTGIGLALVHRLVAAMNGTVDVVNRDPGAEFRVSFPTPP